MKSEWQTLNKVALHCQSARIICRHLFFYDNAFKFFGLFFSFLFYQEINFKNFSALIEYCSSDKNFLLVLCLIIFF